MAAATKPYAGQKALAVEAQSRSLSFAVGSGACEDSFQEGTARRWC